MRPIEFTPASIIEAGQALQDAGRNVTGFALRQRVGGGNPSRLKQVWDEYQAGGAGAPVEPVAELPAEVAEEVAAVTKALTERLGALAVELNDKAIKAAERRVNEVVRSAGEQREQAERELVDAAATVDELEGKIDEANQAAGELRRELAAVQELAQGRAVDLAQVRERLAAVESAAAATKEQHAADVGALRAAHAAELSRVSSGMEAERKARQQEAEKLRSDMEAERKARQEETSELRSKLAHAESEAQASERAHQEQRKRSAEEISKSAERLIKAEAAEKAARGDAAKAREEAAQLRGTTEAMRVQIAELLRLVKDARPDDKPPKSGK